MGKVFGGADDIRIIIFLNIVGTVRWEISRGVKSLESVALNADRKYSEPTSANRAGRDVLALSRKAG